jgi:hypothetical protein
MRAFVRLLLPFILAFIASPSFTQRPQETLKEKSSFRVRVDTLGSWTLWDDSRNELIISDSQGHWERPPSLARVYDVRTGEKRSLDIPTEFPQDAFVYVGGLASGPDGSVLVTCEVNSHDETFIGDRLLLYDGKSKLTANLLAAQYDVGATAMDMKGNIYFAGFKENEASSKETYPLLVKYDRTGHVSLNALPRSIFPNVDDPVGDGLGDPHRGATRVAANEKGIYVYLAPASEMLVLNSDGKIQTRINVEEKLSEFAHRSGYKASYVNWNEFSPIGDLWFVGHLEELSDNTSGLPLTRNFVVRLTSDGLLEAPYKDNGKVAPNHSLPMLIGFTQSNEPVGALPESTNYLLVQKDPYRSMVRP